MSNVYDADDEITNINNEYADVKVAHEISGKIILIFVNHSTKHQDRIIQLIYITNKSADVKVVYKYLQCLHYFSKILYYYNNYRECMCMSETVYEEFRIIFV